LKAALAVDGEDALGEATVWLEQDGKVVSGRGLSTDIIEASARACMNAINKLIATCGHPAVEKAVGGE
jgi:2-isopropylmalate synthase